MGSGVGPSLWPPGRHETGFPKFPKPDVRRAQAWFGIWSSAESYASYRVAKGSGGSQIHRCLPLWPRMDEARGIEEANRTISTGRLRALPHFDPRPINVVVYHGSQGDLV